MKSKSSKKHRPVSGRDLIRSESNYTGGRDLLGVPFQILGWLGLLAAVIRSVTLFIAPELRSVETIGFAMASFMSAMLFFGISALGSALFDLADCAIRRDARDRAKEAKEAYQNYRRDVI